MIRAPRILTIDIETLPALVASFELYNLNLSPDHVVKQKQLACFAAKWHDERKTLFFGNYWDGHDETVARAWELLDEADMIIHYNGNKFDEPELNREFDQAGLGRPSPYKRVDLYVTGKRQFRYTSHKLDAIAKELGIGEKIKHEGIRLWLKCLDDDADAWNRMRKYNKQDTVLTEKLYERWLPWITNHPNLAAIAGKPDICPVCLSDAGFQSRGYRYNSVTRRPLYSCKNPVCGAYVVGREIERLDSLYLPA